MGNFLMIRMLIKQIVLLKEMTCETMPKVAI